MRKKLKKLLSLALIAVLMLGLCYLSNPSALAYTEAPKIPGALAQYDLLSGQTIAVFPDSVGLYNRSGLLMGAHYLDQPADRDVEIGFFINGTVGVCFIDWHPYTVDLRTGAVDAPFGEWLSVEDPYFNAPFEGHQAERFALYYLRDNGFYRFTFDAGEELLAKDPSVWDVKQYIPMVMMSGGPVQSAYGREISWAYFDLDLLAMHGHDEDSLRTSGESVVDLAKRTPVWDYLAQK